MIYQRLVRTFHHFHSDSLYRNSLYLMISTFSMSVFGFFFWIICARLYTTKQIGLATTLISITVLITSFSLLGFNSSLIRYLPKAPNKNAIINTVFTLVTLASLVFGIIYLIGIPWFSPRLLFILHSPLYRVLFVAGMVIFAVNSVSDSVFIAYRATVYIVVYNFLFSLVKLVVPIFLVSLGALGIYSAVIAGSLTAFACTLFFLGRYFQYQPAVTINSAIIRETARFTFGNYIAGFLSGLPQLILPIIITNKLGAHESAYFYMSFMIANLIYIIPQSATKSLFAESSHTELELMVHVKKSIRITALILIPAVLIGLIAGKYILLVFGKDYSVEGLRFLQILLVSSVFMTIKSIGTAVLNVQHRLKALLFNNIIFVVSILGLSVVFMPYGLEGIGYAWMIGNIITTLSFLVL